jgi:branched-chain amino acid transport system substrate-binding protein
MRKSFLGWILMFCSAALIVASCAKKEANTSTPAPSNEILIGHFASLTGDTANFGNSAEKGVRLALAEINAAGGVAGKQVRVITADTASKQEETQSMVTKLITQDNVIAVIGEVASSLSLVAADVAMRNHTPMVSPASTNPKVTQKGKYIFRICFIDPFQGEVMAKFAREKLKAKTAAILRDAQQQYSVGLADFFKKAFEGSGGKVIVDTSYVTKDVDFKGQLTDIKGKNPDVIFVPGYYNEVGLIARQARSLGLKQPLLGGDGWESEDLAKIAGKAIDGSYYSNHFAPDTKDPHAQHFLKSFKQKYGSAPDAMAALGYDALYVIVDSLKRAKSVTREDLRDAIEQTKGYNGITGKISINEEHNAVKSAVVLRMENGEAKFFSSVDPN